MSVHFTRLTAILLALSASACGPLATGGVEAIEAERQAQAACGPSADSAIDAKIFGQLTAYQWYSQAACENGGPLPPTCERLALKADGGFTWSAVSDYPERQDFGQWNFRARDANSGIVCLNDRDVIDFSLTAEGLQWTNLLLSPGPALAERGDRLGLPQLDTPELFSRLLATPWTKTNDLDAHTRPAQFTLFHAGRFEARYRGGECSHAGTFSLLDGQLRPRSETNHCDLRYGGSTASLGNGEPKFIDGLLIHSGASYSSGPSSEKQTLAFASYSDTGGLFFKAEWRGAVRPNHASEWLLTLRNLGERSQTVAALTLSSQPLLQTSQAFSSDGAPVVLASPSVDNVILGPGETFTTTVTVVLPTIGWTSLHFEAPSSDERQVYGNSQRFIVLVE